MTLIAGFGDPKNDSPSIGLDIRKNLLPSFAPTLKCHAYLYYVSGVKLLDTCAPKCDRNGSASPMYPSYFPILIWNFLGFH